MNADPFDGPGWQALARVLPENRRDRVPLLRKRLERHLVGGARSQQHLAGSRRVERHPELFDYQRELADAVLAALGSEGAKFRCLISLPTGGGKTRTVASVVRQLLMDHDRSLIFWVAPSRELLAQAAETLESVWQTRGEGAVVLAMGLDAVRDAGESKTVCFVTAQALARRRNQGIPASIPKPALIVFDEAHHSIAETYLEGLTLLAFHRAENNPAPIIGLSATPGRATSEGTDRLAEFFNRNLIISQTLGPDPLCSLQKRGVLATIRYRTLSSARPEIPHVTDWGTTAANSAELVWEAARLEQTISEIERAAKLPGRTLVFCQSVHHAVVLSAGALAHGIKALPVFGEMAGEERDKILTWFRQGSVKVLINQELLTTGFDLPGLNRILLATPIRSAVKFEQILGRALRGPAVGGMAEAEIVEFEKHQTLHGDPMSYGRYWASLWKLN